MVQAPLKTWTERDGRLLRLRLDRPKANLLDAAMIAALSEALLGHLGEPHLAAVVLDAEGPHFSFGASVEEHMPVQCAAMLSSLHRLLLRMLEAPVPILAAVRGQCLGGGLELVSAATLIFAAPDAKFGQPEIRLGVIAPAASCLLPERVGPARAEDLLFSGRSIDAAEARHIGLVHSVSDDPEAAALAYFDGQFAQLSASSLRFALKAARIGMVERVRAKLGAVEKMYLEALMATRDALEGLNAFTEKRRPRWEDR
jgi:cyclohexa-1,5-dienecarbonyl-CoA hydratase